MQNHRQKTTENKQKDAEIKVLKGGNKSLKKGLFDLIELEIIMGDYYEKYVD